MIRFEITFTEVAQLDGADVLRALSSAVTLSGLVVLEGIESISVKSYYDESPLVMITWHKHGFSKDKANQLNSSFSEICNCLAGHRDRDGSELY
jgi:hypothetical protein